MVMAVQEGNMNNIGAIYRGKRVLVTGHTGFKGAWLSEWLLQLGAEVTGLALSPTTSPSLFDQLGLERRITHVVGDIRDLSSIDRVIKECRPEFVFHLAAQPLVRLSYAMPVETYGTNVMGTVHVLDAIRRAGRPCVVVAVTTDKCYENQENGRIYDEEDALGGHDPYSASKGAAEIAIASYRRSFFSAPNSPVRLASARAGNVIGGGDWAPDRIVPDCIRALATAQAIPVRNKVSTRPWQHVLEPLSGYLWLAACLAHPELAADKSVPAAAFNFGPELASNRTVIDLVTEILQHWPGRWEDRSDPKAVHEAKLLNLSIAKAQRVLGWRPVWDFFQAVAATVQWYRAVQYAPADGARLTCEQIDLYTRQAGSKKLSWAQ
jgi:CDP-glucose 4,6-dehydratase